jgi:type IV secretion system protein TrbL
MQFNALTLALQNFIAAFSAGYAHLRAPIDALLSILVAIDLVLFALFAALGAGDPTASAFKKILHVGLWVWLVHNFPSLAKAFVESLVQAGLVAGGGTGETTLVLDPSRVAGYGLDATLLLAKKLEDLGTFDIPDLLVFGLGYVAVMGCFLLMAINLFLAVLEYYLFAGCVGILLPFGVLAPTRFLAEKAVGAVVSSGIKLLVLSFITATLDPILAGLHFQGPDIALNELWAMLLTVGAMTLLCWKAPSLAAALLAGSPHLSGSELLAAGVAAGAMGSRLGSGGGDSPIAPPAALAATRAAAAPIAEASATSAPAASPGPAAAAPTFAGAPPAGSPATEASARGGTLPLAAAPAPLVLSVTRAPASSPALTPTLNQPPSPAAFPPDPA